MVKTKKQIETSLARLAARYERLTERIRALQREIDVLNDKRRAVAATQGRLEKQIMTPREDRAKRLIIEATVAEKTSRRILAHFDHPDGKHTGWWFRCGKAVLARYAVGDPIEILLRWKKPIGGAGKREYPTIVKLKPYRIESMHEMTGYDS
jgi:hypothetical protein